MFIDTIFIVLKIIYECRKFQRFLIIGEGKGGGREKKRCISTRTMLFFTIFFSVYLYSIISIFTGFTNLVKPTNVFKNYDYVDYWN